MRSYYYFTSESTGRIQYYLLEKFKNLVFIKKLQSIIKVTECAEFSGKNAAVRPELCQQEHETISERGVAV